jgi:hypothetical protein
MSGSVDDLENAVEAMLVNEARITPESIRDWVVKFRAVFPTVTTDEAEAVVRRIEARHQITMSMGAALKEADFKPWLEQAKAGIDFYYWNRYRKFLAQRKYSSKVISTLHEDTDRTLGYLQDPKKEAPWDRRGMVVGHVQSGKTGNYAGLICKAADAGYKLIVVIAGIHNNLRNQTQRRIDEGFVGRDSARLLAQKKEDSIIGVGRIDPQRRPVTFTNSLRDFNKELATGVGVPLQNLTEPAVFVIKKNSSTLKNLVEWLGEHSGSQGQVHVPMLLIDDEADNASINVNYDKGEVTRINKQIRQLLNVFSRSCYVGYTATPFANIFIDPDTDDEMLGADLFPKHFIVSLDPPSNYFGPDRVFGANALDVVRHIDDHEQTLGLSHKIDHVVQSLPSSLLKAVRTFVLARAIRMTRGDGTQHMSMLVNASRFNAVQAQLRGEIDHVLEEMRAAARLNSRLDEGDALRDPEMSALYSVWEDEYKRSAPEWLQIQRALHEAVSAIKIVTVNSRSAGTLNYADYDETGLAVIAVGGYSLSRGLTLEGLMVSYFLRNSMMYDTLLQMGRWFGYRPNCEDLCRVWMPAEAEGWYAHIAESVEELRDEFRLMAAAGATPEEFGLKVRAHPDTLIVTARNKMGAGEKLVVEIGLANHFIETATLRRDEDSLRANRKAAVEFAAALSGAGKPLDSAAKHGSGYLLTEVKVEPIQRFLAAFRNHPASLLTDPKPLGKYIADRADGELASWDVYIPGASGEPDPLPDSLLGVTIDCQRRSPGKKSDDSTLRVTDKQRVASRGVEKTGIPEPRVREAEAAFRSLPENSSKEKINYPDRIYRAVRTRPLLILHLLDIRKEGEKRQSSDPVIAWSISFPQTALPQKLVQYVVTRQWLRENMHDESVDEEVGNPDE